METIKSIFRKYFPQSVRSWLIFFSVTGCASALCFLLQQFSVSPDSRSDVHVPLIFVLSTLIISLTTKGYFYGLLSAFLSVFAVNWAFTFPYWKLDFSIYGYPLTFLTMLAVGFAASTMTSGLKERDRLRMETEREKMRTNLLRSISHDLRTPLTTISGSVSAIVDNSEDLSEAAKKELLLNIRQDADWLCRMVENLLSITRMNGDNPDQLIFTEELPEEVFSEAVMKFRRRNPEVEVGIQMYDGTIFIPMDAMLIEQVLINLMDNAVIHGQTASRIQIIAKDHGEYISVSVADNGKGIDEKIIRHLFDGTLQLQVQDTDKNRFMGIGLLVCQTIIKAHGGTISARNLPGSGAEFQFTLNKGEANDYS